MTVLTLTNPVPGTSADANMIASNNNAILAVINGGLDHNNLLAGAGILFSQLNGYPADATKFARGDGTWAAASQVIAVVTTLPVGPTDGTQVILTDNTATPSYAWLLQFTTASSKWLFLGGSPLYASVDTADGSTGGNNVYSDPSTHAGPSITVPRAGVYLVEYGGKGNGNASGTGSYIGVSVAGSTPSLGTDRTSLAINNSTGIGGMAKFETASIAAASVIKQQIADSDTTRRITMQQRWLSVVPVTVT